MSDDPIELDVVIVNYNSGSLLKKCIEGLLDNEKIKINVFIVDNNSSDQSIGSLKEGQYLKKVGIIQNSSNLGYAKACNQGAKQGRGKLIAFINTDCFIQTCQLFKLISSLHDNKYAALIGCRVINQDGTLQAASRRRLPSFWRIIFHLSKLDRWPLFKGINIKDDGLFDEIQTVEAVNGACWVIKRKHFEFIDGFDEGFPLHFEDLDVFARLKSEGFSVLYDSQVQVVHIKGASSKNEGQIKKWKQQGLLRYFSKHRPKWEHKAAQFILGPK